MTATPLWLCCKIAPGKERKAHALLVSHFISALPPLTQPVRLSRHAKRTRERILVPGYVFVSRDLSEPTWFEHRLLRLQWPADDTRPVVHRILGWVRHDAIMRLIGACDAESIVPPPAFLAPGDKARILLAGDLREVVIKVIKGRKVRVIMDGREISTEIDKLEVA